MPTDVAGHRKVTGDGNLQGGGEGSCADGASQLPRSHLLVSRVVYFDLVAMANGGKNLVADCTPP